MSQIRYLITGASGNLGRPLSELASDRYTVAGTFLRHSEIGGGQPIPIDLCKPDRVAELFERFRPDVVIHTAGSDRSPNMGETIRSSARNVAHAAERIGCRLVALSTDVIFDGTAAPYSETAHPTPVHDYGRAKADAEHIIREAYPEAVLVRTSLIYDFDRFNQQVKWMADQIEAGNPVRLFSDEFRQPIWVWNLAHALLEISNTNYTGILNVAGGERMSRFEFGRRLLLAAGFDTRLMVAAKAEVDAPGRPRDCTLDLTVAQSLLKTRLLTFDEALMARSGHS